MLYIEGLGRQLYPQLDLWETGKPFIERWMENRLSPTTALNKLMAAAPQIVEQLPGLPDLLASAPARMNRLEHRLTEQQQALQELRKTPSRTLPRIAGLGLIMLGSALLLGATGNNSASNLASAGVISTGLGALLLARLF